MLVVRFGGVLSIRSVVRRWDRMSVYDLKWTLLFGVITIALPVSATTPVFRCQKNGQTILTDRPCDAPPSGGAAVSTTSSNDEVTKSITASGQCSFTISPSHDTLLCDGVRNE
jgi:hypothetical protein